MCVSVRESERGGREREIERGGEREKERVRKREREISCNSTGMYLMSVAMSCPDISSL